MSESRNEPDEGAMSGFRRWRPAVCGLNIPGVVPPARMFIDRLIACRRPGGLSSNGGSPEPRASARGYRRSSACGGLSLCCRWLEWIVVGLLSPGYFCAQHEPAEGGRLSVAPCKRSAERSDARSAAWGWHPPKTKEPAARRANERCPNLAMNPMIVRCRDSGGGDRPFVD